jgi:hypothetical protein
MKDTDSPPAKSLSELQEKSKTLLAKFEELRGFL